MTEHSTTHELERPVTTIERSKKLWTIQSHTVENYGYGDVASDKVANEVREELLDLLEEKGIDPASVVFSGYSGNGHEKDTSFVKAKKLGRSITKLAKKANDLHEQGVFDVNPELRESYQAKIAALKEQLATMPEDQAEYFFGDTVSLMEPARSSSNPIHYAGISPTATIGVYDAHMLPTIIEGDNQVSLTPEQVDSALLFQFRPRFVNEHGEPFES